MAESVNQQIADALPDLRLESWQREVWSDERQAFVVQWLHPVGESLQGTCLAKKVWLPLSEWLPVPGWVPVLLDQLRLARARDNG